MDPKKTVWGGSTLPEKQKITPTVMDCTSLIRSCRKRSSGPPSGADLGFSGRSCGKHPFHAASSGSHLFTRDKKAAGYVTAHCGWRRLHQRYHHPSGHQRNGMPAVSGESGMGSYHGKAGFLTFSHTKSIVDKKTWLDLPMRHQPYRKFHEKLLHLFLR